MARMPEFQHVYDAFALFLNKCVLEARSLLWPHEEAWTQANVAEVKRRVVDSPEWGEGSFEEKLERQMRGASALEWMIVCDLYYVYYLPSHQIGLNRRQQIIGWAAQQGELQLPSDSSEVWAAQAGGFTRTGQRYNQKYMQFWLLLLFVDRMKGLADARAAISDPRRMQEILDDILQTIGNASDRAHDMRHAMLYMAFPDLYERSISTRDKQAILDTYRSRIGGPVPGDLDEAIRMIRQTLERDRGRSFDFYRDLRDEWRGPRRPPPPPPPPPPAPSADSDLTRVLSVLALTRNVILYGPPGTGKTYITRAAAAEVAGQPVGGQGRATSAGDCTFWTAFHQSYSYEDFVEGLRPVLSSGQCATPRYEIPHGVFRKACDKAEADPAHNCVLIIDEINRGNIAKILGELITLLEDDKRAGAINELRVKLPYSGDTFSVPSNLYVIGTMNTADRSIALLDMALRRRFAFVELMPRPELLSDDTVVSADGVRLSLGDLMGKLNERIYRDLGRDHQIGHSYFLRVAKAPETERVNMLEFMWNHQILPLLQEYYFGQRDKLAELLRSFRTGEAEDELIRLEGDDLVGALVEMAQRTAPASA